MPPALLLRAAMWRVGGSTANTALHSLSFWPEQQGPEFWQPYAVPSIPTAQFGWLVLTSWLPSLPASKRRAAEMNVQGGATWGPRFLCRMANVSRRLNNTRWLVRFFFSPSSLTPSRTWSQYLLGKCIAFACITPAPFPNSVPWPHHPYTPHVGMDG